jgi:aspartate aminotransferase
MIKKMGTEMTNSPAFDSIPTPHLNPRLAGAQTSATLALNERSAQLMAEGRRIFRFGFGQSPFPIPARVVEALRTNAAERNYLPTAGLRELRLAIADFHQTRSHFQSAIDAEDVVVGPGSKELIFLTQLAFGGELLLPSPSWVSYRPQARLLGLRAHWIETGSDRGWRLQAEDLDRYLGRNPGAGRLLIINYPNNPTGVSETADGLAALASVARKHGLVVLSDEIYGEMHHTGNHISLARFLPEATIVSSGLSKWCGAGGWRLGALVFPPQLRWLREAVISAASETYSAASAPVQYAALCAYAAGSEIERYLNNARRILRAVGRSVCARLREAGVEVAAPEGGFYMFPDFSPHRETLEARGIRTGRELCARLLEETGVALLPGEDFGRPANELTARLAFVDFDGTSALKAASEIAHQNELGTDFLSLYCANIVEGTEMIAAWIEGNSENAPEVTR